MLAREGALCGGKYTGFGLLLVSILILSLLVPRRCLAISSNRVDLPTPFDPVIIIILGTLVHFTYFKAAMFSISNSCIGIICSLRSRYQTILWGTIKIFKVNAQRILNKARMNHLADVFKEAS